MQCMTGQPVSFYTWQTSVLQEIGLLLLGQCHLRQLGCLLDSCLTAAIIWQTNSHNSWRWYGQGGALNTGAA